MALTKIGKEGITGVSNAANATFLTATSAEGVTLAGTLAVTGVHTVGTNAVATSEGGAETTNVVQGLIKAWFTVDNMTILDSFNSAGLTDNATGDMTLTVTNAMANNDYSTASSAGGSSVGDGSIRIVDGSDGTTARTTTVYRCRVGYKTANLTKYDDSLCGIQHIGDLA